MSSLQQYNAKLAEWRRLYGTSLPPPSTVNLTKLHISCAKKGCHERRTQRHHTGNDFWFALLLPQHFAARYIQFRKEDTAPLCEKHHIAIHKVYKGLMQQVHYELKVFAANDVAITQEWCEKWMVTFRLRFERWRKVKVRRNCRKRKAKVK
jgi:hypothetical protein